ncbi:MAG: DUF262 domain-containing protein [Chloroflexota bacterium]|nr:DUF262 domain-containing protein [Chloroflexota bacterium]
MPEHDRQMPHLAYLPAGFVAHVGDRSVSHLTRVLRKMTVVHPDLPVALATAQLARTEPRYRELDYASFASLIDQHSEFERSGVKLVAAGGRALIKRSELNTNERQVHDAIVKAGRALSAADVPLYMEGRGEPTAREVQEVLETSSVIVTVGGGRYDALQPSRRDQAAEPVAPPAPDDRAIVWRDVPVDPAPSGQAPDDGELGREPAPVDADHGRTETALWPLATILAQVGENRLVLPEIQRGYVWKTTQVRDLVDSLYRGFPIGTMLVWSTNESLRARSVGDGARSPGVPVSSSTNYLLDGQQRITSMSKVRSGELPVLFNPLREEFATATVTNRHSPLLVAIADVWPRGAEAAWSALVPHLPEEDHREARERLERLESVLNRRVPVDVLHNFSYEEVTDIFVRVNSRGTRLQAAELAIAQIAQRLPNMISDDVASYVIALRTRGWQFDDQFLLRCLTAVARDRSAFKHLVSMDRAEVTAPWERLMPAMDTWLVLLRARLGLTSTEFIQSINSHVVPVAWIASYPTQVHEDRLLEWFVHSQVWSRYSGSSETALDADLQRLRGARAGNPFPTLMQSLRSGG